MKKRSIFLLFAFFLAAAFSSCRKTRQQPVVSSSLTIVNAISGSGTLATNFDRNQKLTYYKTAKTIDSNSYFQFSGYFGKVPLSLVQYADTTREVLAYDVTIDRGSMQTLFLTGTLDKPEPILVKDEPQVYKRSDSLAGVRFVNLLTGSKAVNITLLDDSSTVINSLNYKAVTGFMPFAVKKNLSLARSYTFEFKDSLTGKVFAAYTLSQLDSLLLKNVTIALVGQEDQNTASVLLINNYLLDLGTP